MTSTDTYCQEPPRIGQSIAVPDWLELSGQRLFKYASITVVQESSTPAMRALLQTVPVVGEHKHTLVDIKIRYLEAGSHPCKPFWHTDCTMDMDHPSRPECHHLYIAGAGSRTQFLWTPLKVAEGWENRITPGMVKQIPEETWVSYGRQHPHRCSPAEFSGWRLLVRVTETDLVRPRNRPVGIWV